MTVKGISDVFEISDKACCCSVPNGVGMKVLYCAPIKVKHIVPVSLGTYLSVKESRNNLGLVY